MKKEDNNEYLLEELNNRNLSLIIRVETEEIFHSRDSGIAPLLKAIDDIKREKLIGSTVIDRVVGKAGAILISYFRASFTVSNIISKPAISTLNSQGLDYYGREIVPLIKGRQGKGCPFEKEVMAVSDPEEGYRALLSLARKMSVYNS